MCESKELIVGYLYDDLSETERRSFDAHLAACGDCRAELAGLRDTRAHLALWSPPERELGFRMVRDAQPAPARVLPMRSRWMPAFGLAAAAVIVLAGASAIANLEVRYDANGFVMRTGWARSSDTVAQTQSRDVTAQPVAATGAAGAEFALLDQRLRDLERAVSERPAGVVQAVSGPRMSDAEMLRRVREIVTDAQSRQEVAVAQKLLQVVQDLDARRRSDLAVLQQGMGQYQGLTNAEIAHTRNIVDQLMRTAAKQEK